MGLYDSRLFGISVPVRLGGDFNVVSSRLGQVFCLIAFGDCLDHFAYPKYAPKTKIFSIYFIACSGLGSVSESIGANLYFLTN